MLGILRICCCSYAAQASAALTVASMASPIYDTTSLGMRETYAMFLITIIETYDHAGHRLMMGAHLEVDNPILNRGSPTHACCSRF